jgi:very-short-patch-repair endonuclease
MILAVEADGASYRDSGSVRDRDRLRKEHLERLGWRFHRLWSTNWFHDPDAEVARLREAYDKAVAASPPPRAL